GRKILSQTIDTLAPAAGQSIGTFLGDEELGNRIGSRGREVIRERTGYGVGKDIRRVARKVGRTIKKSIVDKDGLGRKIIGHAIDTLAPAAGVALGTFMGDPELGMEIGSRGRKLIKDKTGYGAKKGTPKKAKLSKLVS